MTSSRHHITDIIGKLQYRLALAGGWIDQPFVSRYDPQPPGSMVVAAVEPQFRWMDRAGICGSTRSIALKLWGGRLPDEPLDVLVRKLYEAENKGKADPSGSQDMIGIIYPGICRLDYDYAYEGGLFPRHIESINDPDTARWLQEHLYILPVNMRPEGYSPLGRQNLTPEWVRRLGQSGWDCFDAIARRNLAALGQSFNDCMKAWSVLMPDILQHPLLPKDLTALLEYYQSRYAGAMYSGCGGGYLYVASSEPVAGGFQVQIKVAL
ncbi:MAG TPA: hypothetical protein PK052_06615 [Anaerohalosphaeraceae bacterium]|nr:hypothetical protein [Anaerohalosphaeraceae bacterium]HOM77500.1 hypothetical protein [Anaerohalosphaeraceae bacterium]HPO70980.1 hypothetical protein [Anaerohalosphaeraceae bacterium]